MRGVKHFPASQQSRISYDDYARMYTQAHAPITQSYVPPPWTQSDVKLRHVIAARICWIARERNIPTDLEALRTLEPLYYSALRKSATQARHIQAMQRLGGPTAFYAALCYRRYRLGEHSTELARHFGLTPTAIRQALYRICIMARRIFPDPAEHAPWRASATHRVIAPFDKSWHARRHHENNSIAAMLRAAAMALLDREQETGKPVTACG